MRSTRTLSLIITSAVALGFAARSQAQDQAGQRIPHSVRHAPVSAVNHAQGVAQIPGISQLCKPAITRDVIVVTPEQRQRAGQEALPPLTDRANGFAWPDTELGIVKTDQGYAFFASDGGLHERQDWEGISEGNNRYGSVTRTLGTLENPLGSQPPIDVVIRPNPNPTVNAFYGRYDYIGGGPVYRVPHGKPGAGNLLMVYHAEIPTITTQSFYSVLGLASSIDDGLSWTDLGEIVRINQGYRIDMDGYDIGDPNLVISPDGRYFYLYFADWLANGTTHWLTTINFISVARAPIEAVLDAAFAAEHPHAIAFQKRYDGWGVEQAMGGYSQDLRSDAAYWGPLRVNWNSHLRRYQAFINNGNLIAYAESPDGLAWSVPTVLKDFSNDPNQPGFYVTAVGLGEDPSILEKQFQILYTYYPNNGQGWSGASVRRFTVTCD